MLGLSSLLALACATQADNTPGGAANAGGDHGGGGKGGSGGSSGTSQAGTLSQAGNSGSANGGTSTKGGSNDGGSSEGGGGGGAAGGSGGAAAGSGGSAAGSGGSAAGSGGSAAGSGGSSGSAGSGGTAGTGGGGGAGDACLNQMQDGNETDVDCGGNCTTKCATGKGCALVTDCVDGDVCDDSMCRIRGCTTDNCAYNLTRFILGTPGAQSARGQVFVTWDATSLDLDFQIHDPTPENDSDNNWEDDSVEIYLDLNHAKSATYEADDFQINVPRDPGTIVGIGTNLTYGAITVVRTSDAMGYELKVTLPWSALNGAGSQVGKTIGFDIGLNDDSNGGTRETQVMLYGSDQNFNNTSQFGDLTLSP